MLLRTGAWTTAHSPHAAAQGKKTGLPSCAFIYEAPAIHRFSHPHIVSRRRNARDLNLEPLPQSCSSRRRLLDLFHLSSLWVFLLISFHSRLRENRANYFPCRAGSVAGVYRIQSLHRVSPSNSLAGCRI